MIGKKKIMTSISTLLLTTLLLMSIPMNALAETAKVTSFVAFGDSITVGSEPDMNAAATPYGYVDRLYEQALFRGRATVANHGINGLNSTGLNKLMQAIAAGKVVKGTDLQSDLDDPRKDSPLPIDQMKKDLQAATYITLTIGIYDIGTDIIQKYKEMNDEQLKAFADERIKQYSENLKAALTTITTLNPQAKIIIADQYSPIPAVLTAISQKLKPIKENMSAALKAVVQSFTDKKFTVQIAPVAEAFVGSEGLFTHISILDVLPTQEGYAEIAQVFAKTIWGDVKTAVKVKDLITVVVGGRVLDTPFLPTLIDNSTFVPLREYAEVALGAKVDWVGETNTAVIKYGSNQIELTIGSKVMKVNGTTKTIQDVPLFYQTAGETKTYIPLRLMVEGLGLDVQYVGGSHTAYINL